MSATYEYRWVCKECGVVSDAPAAACPECGHEMTVYGTATVEPTPYSSRWRRPPSGLWRAERQAREWPVDSAVITGQDKRR